MAIFSCAGKYPEYIQSLNILLRNGAKTLILDLIILGEIIVALTRLRKLIGDACPEYPEWVRKSHTVWQFLNGARDKDVREELITKGWMKDGKDSKEYDEILKIAEGVINKKKVTKATGKVGCEN